MSYHYQPWAARIAVYKDGRLYGIVSNVYPKPTVAEANFLVAHKLEKV